MSSEGNSCVAVESIGLCPFPLWPSSPADWLPYILLIPLPRRSFPCSFTTTQRSRFFLFSSPSHPVSTLPSITNPRVSDSAIFLSLFASQPLHNRLFPSLDVNPLLKHSLTNSTPPLFSLLFISFFRGHYLNHVRNACNVQIFYLYFNIPRQFAC